jgi:hypothetical protein
LNNIGSRKKALGSPFFAGIVQILKLGSTQASHSFPAHVSRWRSFFTSDGIKPPKLLLAVECRFRDVHLAAHRRDIRAVLSLLQRKGYLLHGDLDFFIGQVSAKSPKGVRA